MPNFRNILYISSGNDEHQSPGFRKAVELAREQSSLLSVLLIHPDIPKEHESLKKKFRNYLNHDIESSMSAVMKDMGIEENSIHTSILVLEANQIPPAITIIRHVLKKDHDLVVKDAEPVEGGRGFKGMDMTLLRKCPCPVLLSRNAPDTAATSRYTVAIDPESREKREKDLSLSLLRLADSLAGNKGAEIDIVSCWEYELEKIMQYKAWISISQKEIDNSVEEYRKTHLSELEKLILEAAISTRHHIHHMKGRPEDIIPEFTVQRETKLLLMGTVARTGIPGFLIGNTAENILEKTACSLLALKPDGYISPVRPE